MIETNTTDKNTSLRLAIINSGLTGNAVEKALTNLGKAAILVSDSMIAFNKECERKMPKTFQLGGHTFQAADCIDGVLVDPVLPEKFNFCEDEDRPASHDRWRGQPYIVSAGDTYQVYCLDGGCHDRATGWGFGLASLGEALAVAVATKN